jgi:hypothetical protein
MAFSKRSNVKITCRSKILDFTRLSQLKLNQIRLFVRVITQAADSKHITAESIFCRSAQTLADY